MKVICTTVIRHTKGGYSHGHIYEIDWESKRIVTKFSVPKPRADSILIKLNPRGGSRGGRGVQITNDNIYIANENTIIIYDHDWYELGRISNQLFTGIHEIRVVEDGIWVANTGNDSAIKVNFSGRVLKKWSPRTDPVIKRILGIEDKYNSSWPPKWTGWSYLNPYRTLDFMLRNFLTKIGLPARSQRMAYPFHVLNINPETLVERWLWKLYSAIPSLSMDNFHLNCVCLYKGEVYVTLLTWPWREEACIVRIYPSTKIELGDKTLGMPHNGLVLDDEHLIINDNESQGLKMYKRGSGKLIKSISSRKLGIEGKAFYRGLIHLGEWRVLVGLGGWKAMKLDESSGRVGKVQIVEIDLKSETVLGRIILSEDDSTSIHGLDAF